VLARDSGETGERWGRVTVVFDQSPGHRLGSLCGVEVALGSRDDRPFHQESGTLADTLGQPDAILQLADDLTTVTAAMKTLSEREQRVLQLRFFEDRTQLEIAEQIGVSQMQISRILQRAIKTLNELTLAETSVANDVA
jgi:RNA polymerase sigma factor (sigma-70 family)